MREKQFRTMSDEELEGHTLAALENVREEASRIAVENITPESPKRLSNVVAGLRAALIVYSGLEKERARREQERSP
jgi:hypothetical protein